MLKKNSLFFFLIPLVSFLASYWLFSSLLFSREVVVPSLIGKKIQEGVTLLAVQSLDMRINQEQEGEEEGVILHQAPAAGRKLKASSHVFVTVSKKKERPISPSYQGLELSAIMHDAADRGLNLKVIRKISAFPFDHCFAQYPQAGEVIEQGDLLVYISEGAEKYYIIPSFKNYSVEMLRPLLAAQDIGSDFFHSDAVTVSHVCDTCTVSDQKPIAGSIIDRSKKLYMQFLVKK